MGRATGELNAKVISGARLVMKINHSAGRPAGAKMNTFTPAGAEFEMVSVTCGICATESAKAEVLQGVWPDLADRDTGRFPANLVTPEQRALLESAAGTIRGPAALR